MFTGLKSLGTWMKTHPAWAAILFLLVIPFLLLGLFARIRSMVAGLPVVGGIATQLGAVGSRIGGGGQT